VLFAYLGPDTMLPVASIVGVIVGMFLMFWRRLFYFARSAARRIWPLGKEPRATSALDRTGESPEHVPAE
jgi:hypothetical protein